MPIHSVYRWKGAIESTAEFMLVAKTRRSLVSPLIRFIQTVHPYEVPEIVATPITAGLAAYLHWIESETKQNKKKTGGVEKR
jgi:periplasmic divalent cation tolerance protein